MRRGAPPAPAAGRAAPPREPPAQIRSPGAPRGAFNLGQDSYWINTMNMEIAFMLIYGRGGRWGAQTLSFTLIHLFPCLEMENKLRALHLLLPVLRAPRKGGAGGGAPHPRIPEPLPWDDVWIWHETGGISINSWASQTPDLSWDAERDGGD